MNAAAPFNSSSTRARANTALHSFGHRLLARKAFVSLLLQCGGLAVRVVGGLGLARLDGGPQIGELLPVSQRLLDGLSGGSGPGNEGRVVRPDVFANKASIWVAICVVWSGPPALF